MPAAGASKPVRWWRRLVAPLAGIVSCLAFPAARAVALETSVHASIEAGEPAAAYARALAELAALASDTTRTPPAKLARAVDLARTFLDEGATDAAATLAERGLSFCDETRPACAGERARAHSILMQCAFASGDLAGARRHQLDVVAFRRADTRDGPALVDALRDLGYIEYQLEDYARAAETWQESVHLAAETPGFDLRTLAWYESDLAEAYRLLGRFTAAESLLVSAVARVRENPPADSFAATIINNLGALYWDEGRLDDAERLYTEALRISEGDPEPNPKRIATAYQNLGVLARDQAKIEESARHLTHALELARRAFTPEEPAFINFLVDLGTTLGALDRWDEAFTLWNEALELLDDPANPRAVLRAKLHHDLGEAHLERGELRLARADLETALRLRRRVLGPAHADVGVTLSALARLLAAAGRVQEATRAADASIEILAPTHVAPEVTAETLALRARLAMASGASSEALALMKQALDRLDALRARRGGGDMTRARFIEEHLGYYGDAVAWMIAAGDIEGAIDCSERARARVLRDRLAAAHVDLRADVPREKRAELERREQDARARIAGCRRRLVALRTEDAASGSEIARLERELDDALGAYRAAVEEAELASPAWSGLLARPEGGAMLATARASLGEGEAVLLYHVAPQQGFGFLIRKEARPIVWQLEVDDGTAKATGIPPGPLTSETLAQLVAPSPSWGVEGPATRGLGGVYREGPGGGSESSFDRLHVLWQVLVPSDAWREITKVSELVVIPDGPLHLLPFEALVTEPARGEAVRAYWLDTGPPLRYGHSIATLHQLSAEQLCTSAGDEIVSFSDPELISRATAQAMRGEPLRSGTVLAPLPGTRRESAAIAEVFEEDRVAIFSGASATETRLREIAPRARYLHLATHGLIEDGGRELLASLVLSPPASAGSGDDGFLHLFEIYELDLCCELAVLSACDTRRGVAVGGEGVFAISRGFLAAGAKRTIASLWSVADASTAALMTAFFERVAARERGALDASYAVMLRDAKRETRERAGWGSPFYWAPFIISGAR